MKKATLLFLLALSGLSVSAQQTINFKIGYKPNMTYNQTTVQTNKTAISYGEGMEPMENEAKTTSTTVTNTGKAVNGEYSFVSEMNFDKDTQAAAAMSEGIKFIGKVKADGQLQIDTMEAPGIDEQTKAIMQESLKANLTKGLAPERKVKVGETFTQTTPTEMPIGPATIVMNTKTTYKLTKVEGKKAYFDVSQTVDMSSKAQGPEIKGSGSGSGTMVYDIDNNFPVENNLSTNFKMTMDMQGMIMDLSVTNMSNETTVITSKK